MKKLYKIILSFLARWALKRHGPFLVAVTGSVGKTSAKEAIFAVLNYRFPGEVRKTSGNMNTEIGVAFSILGLKKPKGFGQKISHIFSGCREIFSRNYPRYLVLELGADKPGDIQYFTRFIRPDISVVTAIGDLPVHLEFYPEKDALIKEKESLVRATSKNGLVILNYDDLSVRTMREVVPKGAKHWYYGRAGDAAQLSIESTRNSLEGVSFKLWYKGSLVPFRLFGVLGWGHIYAAAAAGLVGEFLDIHLLDMAEALKNYKPQKGRGLIMKGIKHSHIVDDSYNAAPLSVENAIESVYDLEGEGRIYILGDMLELGTNTEKAHRIIGKKIAQYPPRYLFLVGSRVVFIEDEAIKNGYPKDKIFKGDKVEEILEKLQKELKEGDVVLVKGSRALRLEKAIEEIKYLEVGLPSGDGL